MYKYKDYNYSLEEVQNAADKEKLSIDEYIKEFNIQKTDPDPDEEGKETPSQETVDATVEVNDTASNLENGSSEPQKTSVRNKTRKKDLKINEAIDYNEATKLDSADKTFLKNKIDFANTEPTTNSETGETTFYEDYLYAADLEKAQDILKNPKKYNINANPIKNPNKEQIESLAEKIIKDKFRYNKIKEKVTSALKNISTEDKDEITKEKVDKFISLDSKYKELSNDYTNISETYANSANFINLQNINKAFQDKEYKFDLNGLRSVKDAEVYLNKLKDLGNPENFITQASADLYNNLVNKYKNAISTAETIVLDNGKEVPKATFNLYKELIEDNQNVFDSLNVITTELNTMPEKLGDLETELSFLKKNYSTASRLGADIAFQLGKVPLSFAGGVSRILNDSADLILEKITGEKQPKNTTGLFNYTSDLIQKREAQMQEEFSDPIKFEDAFKNGSNFTEFFLQELASQTGILAMMSTGFGPGATMLSVSTYEDKRTALEEEEELLGTSNSISKKIGISAGFAAAEVGLGFAPTMKIFNRGFKAIEKVGKRNLMEMGVKKFIQKQLPVTLLKDPAMEAVTEGGTVLVQNVIDRKFGGKKDTVGIFDNVPQAVVSGGLLGTAFSSVPFIQGVVLANLSDYNSYEGYRKNLNQIQKLNTSLQVLDGRSKAAKAIKLQIVQLEKDNFNIINQVEQNVNSNLTSEGFQYFVATTKAQEELRLRAKAIDEDPSISQKGKEELLKPFKKEFDELQGARDAYRQSFKINIDLLPQAEKNEYVNKAKLQLESEGKTDVTQPEINKIAEKIWQIETFEKNLESDIKTNKSLKEAGVNQTYEVAETKAEAIALFTQAMQKRAADPNNSLTESEAEKLIKQFSKNVNSGAANGANVPTKNTKTGKDVFDIIIVKENAINNGKTSTGIHEIGHTIFTSGYSANSESFTPLANAVLAWLEKNNANAYVRIKTRAGNNTDEILTEFLEEVASGRLDLEAKNNKGLLQYLPLGIMNAMNKSTDGKSKFKLGPETDTVQFLKSLGKKLKEGTLTLKDVQEIQEGKITEASIETVIKESRSEEASNKVQELYEQKGVNAAVEIIKQFKPITNKIVEQRKNAPGFDRQLLTDEIETGAGGIFDLIQAYDPASNVPLAAYINKYLPVRSITASRRILGEEFTDDITESVQVAAETTPEAEIEVAETKPTERLIEVKNKFLSPEGRTAFEENIASRINELTPGEFTFKKLPNWGKEDLAKELNIPLKKFEGSSNFTQAELGRLLTWIETNVSDIRRALPGAAVLEGASVPESLIGTATGVPNNLLKNINLYERLARGTKEAGLIAYRKLRGIDNSSILKAVNIVDGKQMAGPRDKAAQTAKGIFNMMAKVMTNQEIRKQLQAKPRPDITTKETESARAGGVESRLLFSKNISKEERNKRNKILINESTKAFKENPSFDEYLKRIRPVLQDNKVTKALSDPQNKAFKGNIYEYYIWERLNSLNINGLKLMPPEYGTGTDIKATFFRRPFDLEVKLNLQDAFGAPTIYFDSGKNKWSFDESNLDQEIFNIVEKNIDQQKINNFLTEIQKLGAYSLNEAGNKKEKVDFTLRIPAESYKKNKNKSKTGKIDKLTASVYKKIAGKQLNKQEKQSLNNAIIEYYNKKDINYIVVDNQMYYLKENPLQLPINQLTGDVYIKFRIKPGSLKKNKKLGNFYNLMTVTQFGMDKATSKGTPLNKAFQTKLSKSISKAEIKNNKELLKKFQLPKGSTNEQVLAKMQELDDEANEARIKYSKSQDLNEDFNNIIEAKTGIATYKRFSPAKAEVRGASKGKFNFFIPPSAEDFTGLLYKTLAKGKVGDTQMQWYKDNLLDPYARAMNDISAARVAMFEDYKALKNDLEIIPKDLKKKSVDEYTREQAVRVYIWNDQGNNVPGLFKTDQKDLVDYVNKDSELKLFAEQLIAIQKNDEYSAPKEGWLAGSITTDLLESVNSIKRKKYLEQWQTNVDLIFSEENMNKLEAAFGKPYVKALENILTRMKTGRNKPFTSDSLAGRVTDWLNNSVGAIMFFNTRSAVLQTISSINFVNWSDNNIYQAGKALANQPQYWKDFKFLFNSDFLKERRGGLRFNVSESEIADAAKKGGARGVVSKILQAGFLPTQMADSFAIASGGATFYRNRVKSYVKEGLTKTEAQEKAFLDFREIAEESQQSSRPDRISAQQAGPLGRTILAFANTPAQYARLTKKAASDLINGRGDAKTNISKLLYYGFVQNLVFNMLQKAVFMIAFGDDDEDEKKKEEKYLDVANGMADGLLRGMGVQGAIASTLKNTLIRIIKESEKARPDYAETALTQLLGISPPIQSKAQKVRSALKSYEWNKDEMLNKGFSLDNPAYMAGANIISAGFNVPLDRVVKKVNNIAASTQEDISPLERSMLIAGWSEWELGIQKPKKKKKKKTRSSRRGTGRNNNRSSNRR